MSSTAPVSNRFAKLIALITTTILVSSFSIAYAAPGGGGGPNEKYTIDGTPSLNGFTLTLDGNASGNPYVGQFDQHQVQVIWGDGNTDDLSTINFVEGSGKTFSGTWTNSHTYANPGTYIVSFKLYHGNPNGADGSDSLSVTLDPIVIPPLTGTLNVIHNVINDNGGTLAPADLTDTVTGTNPSPASFAGSTSGTAVTTEVGSYGVTSSSAFGYTQTLSADCSGTIAVDETKTCTITDDDIAPLLTVTKVVVNNNEVGLLPSDFPLFVDQTPVTSEQQNTFSVGIHTVTETNAQGYTGIFSGACNPSGQVTLAVGDVKNCILTNTDSPTPIASLTVIKNVINDNGGDKNATDFTMNVTGTGVSSPSFPGSASGVTVTMTPGDFSVDETGLSTYAKTLTGDCSGTIADGEQKTCTITNDDIAAKLTVTKVVVNDDQGSALISDFPLSVGNTSVISGVENSFSAGVHIVSEQSFAGYTATFSGDCDSVGSITLALGDVKNCTITNNDNDIIVEPNPGSLTIIKHVINDNGGTKTAADFTINVTGTNPSSTGFAGSENGTTITLSAGAYSVDEALLVSSPSYAKTLSADCVGTIEDGDEKTCTITNNDIAIIIPEGGGGGGGGGSSGGGGSAFFGQPASSGGEVLGAKISAEPEINQVSEPISEGEVLGEHACSIYLHSFIHINRRNNPDEVKKLQLFLNEYLNLNLDVSGDYNQASFNAVKQFQSLEFSEVLNPWKITKPTGYVYLTTRRHINMIKCPSLNLPMPELKLGLLN